MLNFGIFDHFERPRDVPLDQAYEERLRLLSRADELGYYAYHLAEHHQSPLCMAPSQNVFLAAATRCTQRIKLGTLVHLLPMYHPLRFIEEICMLDNLSQGRLQIGLGRGITAIEHTYWGLQPEEAQRRYQESLAIIVQGLTSDTLNHHGEFFNFDNVPLEMTPRQRPYPPFWYASKTPDDAAREGLNYVTHPGPRLPETMARYAELWDAHRHRPDRLNAHVQTPMIGSSRHIVVADTDAEAERIARTAWPVFQDNFSKRGMVGPGPETRPDGSTLPVPPGGPGTVEARDFDRARRAEAVLVGSPETIGDYVQRYAAESGANYFMAAFQWGNISHAQAVQSLELFATQVMPRVGAQQETRQLLGVPDQTHAHQHSSALAQRTPSGVGADSLQMGSGERATSTGASGSYSSVSSPPRIVDPIRGGSLCRTAGWWSRRMARRTE